MLINFFLTESVYTKKQHSKSHRLLSSAKLLVATFVAGATIASCECTQTEQTAAVVDPIAAVYDGVPFEMPEVQLPAIPANEASIVDFGAVGDGLFLNTEAISKTIDHLAAKGGGKVIIPSGIWLTGPIVLKSNIEIHTEDGALVRFSDNFDHYPLITTSFEGLDTYRCMSPIMAHNLENIAFTGSGTFDGAGDSWRFVKKEKMTSGQWKKLLSKGGVLSDDGRIWFPSQISKNGHTGGPFNVPDFNTKEQYESIKDYLRPVMVSIANCKNVLLDGPTFQNSPAWNLHPLMCENIVLRNLSVRNPWYSQNGDGLDLESCKNALIYNNTFDVGDDAICIKSGKDADGRKRGMPTENVIVKNNIVYHGHGGFVVGSEMSGGVKNIYVKGCTFMGTDIGLRFKSTRGRGGVVENIYIEDIDMIDIPAEPIRFNLFYGGQSPILEADQKASNKSPEIAAAPVTEETPAFKNIYMKHIRATGSGIAGFFQGLPEMNLQNVNLEDAILEAKTGITFIDVDGVNFTNVKIMNEKGAPLTIYNGKNISLKAIGLPEGGEVKILGKSGNVTSDLNKDVVTLGETVDANTIQFQ